MTSAQHTRPPDQHAETRDEPREDDGRHESYHERLDRNMAELTGELRVVVTGVQVLFAFLLVVPFNSGFRGIGPFERAVYLATLVLAALAAACTIAPSAAHRILFRADDKQLIVSLSNNLSIAGLGFLALAMSGSVLLVVTKLSGTLAGAILAGLALLLFATLWFALPLARRSALRRERHTPSGESLAPRPGADRTPSGAARRGYRVEGS